VRRVKRVLPWAIATTCWRVSSPTTPTTLQGSLSLVSAVGFARAADVDAAAVASACSAARDPQARRLRSLSAPTQQVSCAIGLIVAADASLPLCDCAPPLLSPAARAARAARQRSSSIASCAERCKFLARLSKSVLLRSLRSLVLRSAFAFLHFGQLRVALAQLIQLCCQQIRCGFAACLVQLA